MRPGKKGVTPGPPGASIPGMAPIPPLRALALAAALSLPAATALCDDPPQPPPVPPPQQTGPTDGAAPAPRRRMGPGYSLEELTSRLALTAAQQKAVGAIIESARSQGRALRNDTTLSWDARREKMRQVAKASREQIRAALTADQQKQFDALPPPQHGGRPKGPDAD